MVIIELRAAAIDDTELPASFAQVCFEKFYLFQ